MAAGGRVLWTASVNANFELPVLDRTWLAENMLNEAYSRGRCESVVVVRLFTVCPITYRFDENPFTFPSLGTGRHANTFHLAADGIGVLFKET